MASSRFRPAAARRSRPTLASDVKIDVDVADIRFAQRDDKVTVNGKTTQARPTWSWPNRLQIDLANPLSRAKEAFEPGRQDTGSAPSKAKKEAGDGDDLLGGAK